MFNSFKELRMDACCSQQRVRFLKPLTAFLCLQIGLICFFSIKPAYSQQSDHHALFKPTLQRGKKTYKTVRVMYTRSLDLSPLYVDSKPTHSSIDFIHEGSLSPSKQTQKAHQKHTNLAPATPGLSQLESALIRELGQWPNLKITSPKAYQRRMQKRGQQQRLAKLAHDFISESKQAYREVDLERTRALLDSAIELWTQSRYALIDPVAFGLLFLKRGVVAVEQDQVLSASLDFRKALLLAPHLRLKEGFDSKAAVRVFTETLNQLRALSPAELIKLAEVRAWVDERYPSMTLIKVRDQVYSLLWRSPTAQDWGIRARIKLASNASSDEAMSRLASKIWLCLPMVYDQVIRDQSIQRWDISAGWGIATPLKSPVSQITQPGLLLESSLRALSQLKTKLGVTFTNSTQDEARDLASSFTMVNVYVGPLWVKSKRHWWTSLGVMLEGSYLSSTAITRTVGCKFFDLSSQIPNEICDPKRDIREIQSAWRIGPRAQINAGLHLSDRLRIALQVFGSVTLYQSTEHPFLYPIGAGILIGYSFNSR